MVTLIAKWVRKVLWDEAYAEQYLRSALYLVAMCLFTGVIDLGKLGWYGGMATMAASIFIRSGDRNPNLDELVARIKQLETPPKP